MGLKETKTGLNKIKLLNLNDGKVWEILNVAREKKGFDSGFIKKIYNNILWLKKENEKMRKEKDKHLEIEYGDKEKADEIDKNVEKIEENIKPVWDELVKDLKTVEIGFED